MANPSNDLVSIIGEYQRALADCKELYRASAREYAHMNPDQVRGSTKEFVQRMLDLHNGLCLKVFVDVAHVDWHWSPNELALAEVLFEHVWGKTLKEDELRETLSHLLTETRLTWDSLVGPFDRLARIRKRAGELQTVVMRMANLIAKADGRARADKVTQIRWIQAELQRALERIPVVGDPPASEPTGAQAYQSMNFEIKADEAREEPILEAVPLASEELLAETLRELDELIGLEGVKQEVTALVNYLKMQKERERFGLPQTRIALHAVYEGNPGTGKTTVARLVGRVYAAMGILAKGHLVETDRAGLVAEYAGQTAPKTHKKVDEALDGVLFIDEAYSLVAERGDDPYGAEAVNTLLKRMEDNRDRLIVILAGYPEPMEKLIASNPGLSSRFPQHLHFPDYSPVELGRIFERMCRQNEYVLPALTRAKLLLGFRWLLAHKDERFGNGRLARNLFEKAIGRLANRIASMAPLTREILTTIEPGDVLMKGVPTTLWTDLASETRRFQITCPGCAQSSSMAQRLLGRNVQCRRCQHAFVADWGDPLGD